MHHPSYSVESVRLIEMATDVALRCGAESIDTTHIFVAYTMHGVSDAFSDAVGIVGGVVEGIDDAVIKLVPLYDRSKSVEGQVHPPQSSSMSRALGIADTLGSIVTPDHIMLGVMSVLAAQARLAFEKALHVNPDELVDAFRARVAE